MLLKSSTASYSVLPFQFPSFRPADPTDLTDLTRVLAFLPALAIANVPPFLSFASCNPCGW